MNEYKLWELAKTRDEVHILAQQVVEDWDGVAKTLRTNWDEEAVALSYAVHQEFWSRAQPDSVYPPYTHRTSGHVVKVLRSTVPDIDRLFTQNIILNMVRSIYAALAEAQLLLRVGPTGGGSTFYIRAWPPGFTLEWATQANHRYIPLKDRPDLDRQDRKAVKVAGPVEKHTDFRAIPPPDPNLESVMAYIKKIMPLMNRLQNENDELRQKFRDLENLEQSRWLEVTDEIDRALQEG